MTIPKCTSWRGHKFEGRYSSEPKAMPSTDKLFWISYQQGRDMISASVKRTYERDVCVRCGATVEKAK